MELHKKRGTGRYDGEISFTLHRYMVIYCPSLVYQVFISHSVEEPGMWSFQIRLENPSQLDTHKYGCL